MAKPKVAAWEVSDAFWQRVDYIPHVQGHGDEARDLRRRPGKRARR